MSNVIDFKSYDFNHMSLTISSFKVFLFILKSTTYNLYVLNAVYNFYYYGSFVFTHDLLIIFDAV